MYTDKDYRALLADIDPNTLSPTLNQYKNGGKESLLTEHDKAVLARLLLMRGRSYTAPRHTEKVSGVDQRLLARVEMIAAGKVETEADKKGLILYKRLLADIDRRNGCKCGYGSKLRGVKMQVAHFLKTLEA